VNDGPVLGPVHDALGQGDWALARRQCGDILTSWPDLAAVHHALGLACCGEAEYLEARSHLERALALEPGNARWRRDLGAVQGALALWADVVGTLGPVLAELDVQALTLFLSAGVQARRADAALVYLDGAGVSLPEDPGVQVAYANLLAAASRQDRAEAVLRRCLAANHDHAAAHDALAHLCNRTDRPDLALVHWRQSARLAPHSAYRHLRLALALCDRGLASESREIRLRAETIGLTRLEEHSTRLYLMLFDPLESAASIRRAAEEAFNRAGTAGAPAIVRARGPERLRVGYLSGEFRTSPAVYFFQPFLTHHDREAVEVFLYNCCPEPDPTTRTFVSWGEHWREVADLNEDMLVRRLRDDALDVVVDLSGHFPHNRLQALCNRVATAQFTYPNYPATTGCPGVDRFLTDAWTSPPGSEPEYSERLCRLPSGYLAFAPPSDSPDVGPLPCGHRGFPTFGVFQRLLKFNDEVWDMLALVLARAADARLLIQNGDPEIAREGSDAHTMILRSLDRRGIDPARVTTVGPLPRLPHLATVTGVDVALDTFPYTGQTTTCESLWMGVPVVTRPGDTHVSRVSAGLIARAGHREWVADSPAAYAEAAVRLVEDVPALARVRRSLRDEFVAAGLTDGAVLARDLEAAYRAAT
jgi:protein O-GlcNAc transferase